MNQLKKRHLCTKCRKKRLERFLKPVREADKKGSKVWICIDGCFDGRMNNKALSFLQELKSKQDQQKSIGSSALSNVPEGKLILDACCGKRKFWFDKENPYVIFSDKESVLAKDNVQDFRNMKYKDKSFKLVVFDPPHLFKKNGVYSWLNEDYGTLDQEDWPMDIKKGFEECFRVLEDYGILIFKWNEGNISVSTILSLCPMRPLFGHTSDKKNKTHWLCFMKFPRKRGPEINLKETF